MVVKQRGRKEADPSLHPGALRLTRPQASGWGWGDRPGLCPAGRHSPLRCCPLAGLRPRGRSEGLPSPHAGTYSSCPGPLAHTVESTFTMRSTVRPLWALQSPHRHGAPGDPLQSTELARLLCFVFPPAARDRAPRTGHRGPSGLRGRTLAPHPAAERPQKTPGLQLAAEQRATPNRLG